MVRWTAREERILDCLLQAMSQREICKELGLSDRVVRVALNRMYRNLRIGNRYIKRVKMAVLVYNDRKRRGLI